MLEDTESFLVSIQQTIPPLTVQTGSTEVFIEDDDGMLRLTTKVLAAISKEIELNIECFQESLQRY